jgi:hypothetical protein
MVISNEALTTLPHYLAMIPWRNSYDTTYPYMVFVCTTLSFAWHFYGEPKNTVLFYADHTGALIWLMYDLHLAAGLSEKKRECIIASNTASFLLYALSAILGEHHSAWHIFSALKCILVSVIVTSDQ